MAKVTGIGGVFFKANDPEALKAWYVDCLGVDITEWGFADVVGKGLEESHDRNK